MIFEFNRVNFERNVPFDLAIPRMSQVVDFQCNGGSVDRTKANMVKRCLFSFISKTVQVHFLLSRDIKVFA